MHASSCFCIDQIAPLRVAEFDSEWNYTIHPRLSES